MRQIPLDKLSDIQREKTLKFGCRGYDLCNHSLRRLTDFDRSVYDDKLDMFFENHKARVDYLRETKDLKRARLAKKRKKYK